MQRATFRRLIAATFFLPLLFLFGCGSSDDSESDYEYAYIQFYNGSPNSATVIMQDDDGNTLGSAQYGDATSLLALEAGTTELEFIRMDADDQEVLIDTISVDITTGDKTLIVLSNDFASSDFQPYAFERESLEDRFRLMLLNVSTAASQYDVYMSDDGEPFSAAHYLGVVANGEMVEAAYWDGDEDSDDFVSGDYTLYFTFPGEQEVLFESPTITFSYDTEYVLAIRDVSGALQQGLTADLIINSSSIVNYSDIDALSQYRLYNSTNEELPVKIELAESAEAVEPVSVSSGEITPFISAPYGDYRLTITGDEEIAPLNNKLVTLSQGTSKALIVYASGGKYGAVTLPESTQPQAYDKTINVVNLVDAFEQVDVYLVRKDETIETATYQVANLEFTEHGEEVIPADYYEVVAVSTDDNNEQTLLDRTALIGFTEDTNYIITVEPAQTATGYEVVVLHQ